MPEKSKTNMLSKLKFVRKVPSNSVTGKEMFFFKYLYKDELKHISATFIKYNFIMPKFRKRNGGAILDFFSLKIVDSSVLTKTKEIVQPGREEWTINGKEIDNKKSKQLPFKRWRNSDKKNLF